MKKKCERSDVTESYKPSQLKLTTLDLKIELKIILYVFLSLLLLLSYHIVSYFINTRDGPYYVLVP